MLYEVITALHEIVVRQPASERPAFHRQGVAETVNHKHCFRMDKLRDLGPDIFGIAVLAHGHAVAIGNTQLLRGPDVDPQRVFGHLLEQQM